MKNQLIFGLDLSQGSTLRGIVLLITVSLTVIFGLLGRDGLANDIFLTGLAAVGTLGVMVKS